MKLKKKLLIAVLVVAGIAFVSGASILAASTFGTSSDPLVTLSYLTNKLKPEIMSAVSADIEEAKDSFTSELDDTVSGFQADIDAQSGGTSGGETDTFTLVTLSKGQSVLCSVGTELLLRIGTATAVGSSPAMVDFTTGTTLSSGGSVETNHMYMVTIQGNGFTATSATVKILIRGTYTID